MIANIRFSVLYPLKMLARQSDRTLDFSKSLF